MRILVACEFSGKVTDRLIDAGHDAWSCDLLECEGNNPDKHLIVDAVALLQFDWDMVIAFPPCTHLAASGARYWKQKQEDGRQQQAYDFFMDFIDRTEHIPMIAIENPIGFMNSNYRKPDQIIQPYHFGHPVQKSTCLWLKNLPLLQPTEIVEPEYVTLSTGRKCSKWVYDTWSLRQHKRGKARSITFDGIADAMASQWPITFQPSNRVDKNTKE